MPKEIYTQVFHQSSVVYYYSSLFFPANVRQDVAILYAFVRTVDNMVDRIPPDVKGFKAYCQKIKRAWRGIKANDPIIDGFIEMAKRKEIELSWLGSFLDSMRADLTIKKYQTFTDLEKYVYGSAEVVGLMMAKILNLPKAAFACAQLQGKTMQLINFIRDIDEDFSLGRIYLPQEDLKKFDAKQIPPLSNQDRQNFVQLVRFELNRCFSLQEKVKKCYHHLPTNYRLPVKTAADMYLWTAKKIAQNPLVVFQKKVKPNKWQVISCFFKNWLFR